MPMVFLWRRGKKINYRRQSTNVDGDGGSALGQKGGGKSGPTSRIVLGVPFFWTKRKGKEGKQSLSASLH